MQHLTVVIPVRNFRLEQLIASIDALLGCGAKCIDEIIVVDFGSCDPVKLQPHPKTRVIRVEADVWSSSEAINIGVLSAKNSIVAKIDADMLVPKYAGKRLDSAASHLGREDAASMFLAQPIDLPPEIETSEALQLALTARDASVWEEGHVRPRWGEGGLSIFSVDKWNEIGGFDTRFVDWGNEDNDFSRRIRLSGGRVIWMEYGTIVHVWHSPAVTSPDAAQRAASNKALFEKNKSVYRPHRFRHSSFISSIASPDIMTRVRPMVTVAIATSERLNRDQMIAEAILRFQGQLDHDFEIVVVDNGSSKTATKRLRTNLNKLRGVPQPRVEVLESPSIPASRNLAAQVARGRYICVVDDDDLALPNRLIDHLRPLQEDPQAHGSHGGWIDFDDKTGVIEVNQGKSRSIETLLAGTGKITAHPASFYRTDVMRAIPYDESFELGSDLDVAVRQALNGIRIAHTGSFVVLRRFHSENVTRTGYSKQLSSGVRTRSRALEVIGATRYHTIRDRASKQSGLIECTPHYSMQEIVELMPEYAGVWTVFCAAEGIPKANSPEAAEFASKNGAEICTLESGLDQPLVLAFSPVETARTALDLQAQAERVLETPVMILPSDEIAKLRKLRFKWSQLLPKASDRVWLSPTYVDLRELLSDMATLPAEIAKKIIVVSDHTEENESYYLALPHFDGNVEHAVWLIRRCTGRTLTKTSAFNIRRVNEGEY